MPEVAVIRCNNKRRDIDIECVVLNGEDALQRAREVEAEYRRCEPEWAYGLVIGSAEVATLRSLLVPGLKTVVEPSPAHEGESAHA